MNRAKIVNRKSLMRGKAMKNRPNILFLFPDQLRFDWIGSNPDIPVKTPNLDRLEREGVKFTNAICPSPLCAPCRASLAAGKEYDRCDVPSNGVDYPLEKPTVYQLLRDSGYHVMGCGKFDLHKNTLDWGLDGKRLINAWGFSDGVDNEGKLDGTNSGRETPKGPYLQFLESRGLREIHVADFTKRRRDSTFPTPLPDDAYCDNWLAQNGVDLIRRAPSDRPWFLQVNFTGPHSPWDITESMTKLYQGVRFPQPNRNDQLMPETHDAIRQNYSAMVENIDRWTGIYIDELRQRGELENTLIVFSSDHGEMLGDHNRWGKSLPYHPSVGVPLTVWGPGVRKNAVCNLPTTILDLTATFLDYAGLSAPDAMDSRSLKALLEGKTETHRDYVLSGLGAWRLVFDGRYKLIRGFEDETLLFNLEGDALENHNFADDATNEVERLSKVLQMPNS
jgi:arylsulfatase